MKTYIRADTKYFRFSIMTCTCCIENNMLCFLQLLKGNFVLFLTYTLGHRKDFQDILLVIMVSVFLQQDSYFCKIVKLFVFRTGKGDYL